MTATAAALNWIQTETQIAPAATILGTIEVCERAADSDALATLADGLCRDGRTDEAETARAAIRRVMS